VLDIAPLIMVSLPTVSSFFSMRGCFLRGGRSPFGDPPPLSLACGWPLVRMALPPVDGGASRVLWFKILRVQGKGGRTGHRSGLGRPAWAHLAPVRSPIRCPGSSCNYVLCPLHLHDFDDVILASKMEVLFAWSSVFYASIPGGVPRSTSVLATIRSDFIKLMNTNKTP
jgi:hypothetical protein